MHLPSYIYDMIKDIKGFEGQYSVSDDGHVYSHFSKRFLIVTSKDNWYLQVKLPMGKGQKRKAFKIHTLIANTFIPKPNVKGKLDVNHKNGIKTDNRVENLEWMTRSDNVKHCYSVLGRKPVVGEKHPRHRLILDFETGIYYMSSAEAAIAKGLKKEWLLNRICHRPGREPKSIKATNLRFV